MRWTAALLLSLLVCGCTRHGSEAHRAGLSRWIGISETELTNRLGQPDATSGDVSQKFVIYNNTDARYVNSAGYRYDHDHPHGFGRPPRLPSLTARRPSCSRTSVCEPMI